MKVQNNNYLLSRGDAVHFMFAVDAYNNIKKPVPDFYINDDTQLPHYLLAEFLLQDKQQISRAILVTNLLYFIISLYFTFLIGKFIVDTETGVLSALLLSMYPAMYGLSRIYGNSDFAVIACVAFNIYCLLKSDNFKHRIWSLLYGISLGLGLLIKDIFIVFFIAPFVYCCFNYICRDRSLKTFLNLSMGLILGCLIAVPVYIRSGMAPRVIYGAVSEPCGAWYEFNNLRVYTLDISEKLLSPPFFIMFFMGLLYFIKRFKNKDIKAIFLMSVIFPWLVIVFMPHRKYVSYAAPFLPVIAVISAFCFTAITRSYKKYLVCACLFVSLVQYADFSFGLGPQLYNYKFLLNNRYALSYYSLDYNVLFNFDKRKERYEKIVSVLSRHINQDKNTKILVTVNIDDEFLDPIALEIIAWEKSWNFMVFSDSVLVRPKYLNELIFNNGITNVLYYGKYDFGSGPYVNEQYDIALGLALSYPGQGNIAEELIKIDKLELKKKFLDFSSKFNKKEELLRNNENTLYLYSVK
jgi:hypothetical protein